MLETTHHLHPVETPANMRQAVIAAMIAALMCCSAVQVCTHKPISKQEWMPGVPLTACLPSLLDNRSIACAAVVSQWCSVITPAHHSRSPYKAYFICRRHLRASPMCLRRMGTLYSRRSSRPSVHMTRLRCSAKSQCWLPQMR